MLCVVIVATLFIHILPTTRVVGTHAQSRCLTLRRGEATPSSATACAPLDSL